MREKFQAKNQLSDYGVPYVLAALCLSVLAGMGAIILGPQYSHWINLVSLALSGLALLILWRSWTHYSLLRKAMVLILLLSHLFLAGVLIYYKYGYFNWTYDSLFTLSST